jgi:hypothetical protein
VKQKAYTRETNAYKSKTNKINFKKHIAKKKDGTGSKTKVENLVLTCIMRIFLESTISEVANIKTICGKKNKQCKTKTNQKSHLKRL